MLQNEGPPEPWRSFFDELDQLLDEPVELHCCGGFTLIHSYGVARTTNDIDFIGMVPHPMLRKLSELGGKDSGLHEQHKVYSDPVTVATPTRRLRDQIDTALSKYLAKRETICA
jgi:hypothetical protein